MSLAKMMPYMNFLVLKPFLISVLIDSFFFLSLSRLSNRSYYVLSRNNPSIFSKCFVNMENKYSLYVIKNEFLLCNMNIWGENQ